MAKYVPHLKQAKDGQFYTTLTYGANVVYTSETVEHRGTALKPFKTLRNSLTTYYIDHTSPLPVKLSIAANKPYKRAKAKKPSLLRKPNPDIL